MRDKGKWSYPPCILEPILPSISWDSLFSIVSPSQCQVNIPWRLFPFLINCRLHGRDFVLKELNTCAQFFYFWISPYMISLEMLSNINFFSSDTYFSHVCLMVIKSLDRTYSSILFMNVHQNLWQWFMIILGYGKCNTSKMENIDRDWNLIEHCWCTGSMISCMDHERQYTLGNHLWVTLGKVVSMKLIHKRKKWLADDITTRVFVS